MEASERLGAELRQVIRSLGDCHHLGGRLSPAASAALLVEVGRILARYEVRELL